MMQLIEMLHDVADDTECAIITARALSTIADAVGENLKSWTLTQRITMTPRPTNEVSPWAEVSHWASALESWSRRCWPLRTARSAAP